MVRKVLFPKPRRHTYYFLEHAKQFAPVYLDTEVDMTAVIQQRKQFLETTGTKISYLSFLIQAMSQVIKTYPEANSAIKKGFLPKIGYYDRINAKFTLDKMIDGQRAVVAGLIADADQKSLLDLQSSIDHHRDRPFEEIVEFASIRKLHSLPLGIGQFFYNRALANLERRDQLQGTFCVTSLGHRPVHSFYPIISATVCFGVGAIEDKPVVVEGQIVIRPMMRLNMAFDHRAMDGGMAADLLADVKQAIETLHSREG